jgi:glycosyltransferase involved in cell wall biosynthesis
MRRDSLKNRPHYNGLFVNDSIIEKIRDIVPFDHLEVPDPPAAYQPNTQPWAVSRFQNYVREVGRYKVYFNPTVRSPMPRARGEAMMAGLATVSLRNHDVDLFIRNGVNGFFGDTPEELAEQILYLYRNPRACERMQQASRRTALDMFNLDRYLAEWRQVLWECAR